MTRLYMFVQRHENILSANWLYDECDNEGGWELLAGSSKKLTFLEMLHVSEFQDACPVPVQREHVCHGDGCRTARRTSMLQDRDDPQSLYNVRRAWRIFDCNMSYMAKRRQHATFYDPDITTATVNIAAT